MPSVLPGCPTGLVPAVCAFPALPQQRGARSRFGAAVLKQPLSYRPPLRTRSQGGRYPTVLTCHAPASSETYSGGFWNCFGRCLRKITPRLNRSARWRRFISIALVSGGVLPVEVIGSPGRGHLPCGLSRRRPRLV